MPWRRILVTGANGQLGTSRYAAVGKARRRTTIPHSTDVAERDITDEAAVMRTRARRAESTVICQLRRLSPMSTKAEEDERRPIESHRRAAGQAGPRGGCDGCYADPRFQHRLRLLGDANPPLYRSVRNAPARRVTRNERSCAGESGGREGAWWDRLGTHLPARQWLYSEYGHTFPQDRCSRLTAERGPR